MRVRQLTRGSSRRVLTVMFLILALASCGGGGGKKGTCTNAGGCGDDFTHGQCSLINGTFHAGASCVTSSPKTTPTQTVE